MQINNTEFSTDLITILLELKKQLVLNSIPLLNIIKDDIDNVMITCPYHKDGQERKPSAGIKKSDGTFHCFACGEVHSLPEVISYCLGRRDDMIGSFGWNWLLKNFATVEIESRKDIDLDISRDSRQETVEYVDDNELDKYRYYHPYMWARKLTPEIVEVFDIGYDDKTECLTFPVRDINGKCLFVARRSVHTKYFNYPKRAKKPLYGIYELYKMFSSGIRGAKWPIDVIVCESMIDALTCWVYGKFAVALNGLGNDLQFEQLRNLPCRKLILATDNDEAGQKARQRIKANVKNKVIAEYILPPYRKDINELSKYEFDNLQETL